MVHITFPNIGQFRNAVHEIVCAAEQVGTDDHGDPVYDKARPKPTLTFSGSVKLHGMNVSVCFNADDGLWVQSREAVLTQGGEGFYAFTEAKRSEFMALIDRVYAREAGATKDTHTVSVFGEWCGGSIKKGVGVAQMPKSFFVFAALVTETASGLSRWVEASDLCAPDKGIYNVASYPTWQMEIDFNHPEAALERLTALTDAVEKRCPVAAAFGFEGIGEGIVWTAEWNGSVYRFKVKGAEHSVVRAKEVATVAPEVQESLDAFIAYAVTPERFEQGLSKVWPDGDVSAKKLGDLIRWMTDDILKEESDTLKASGLDAKKVGGLIAARTRTLFFEKNGSAGKA